MMLRCTNSECRSCLEFNIQASGDRWKYNEETKQLEKVKAGKRTKDLEDVKSYQAKCMICGHKDLVKKMIDAYENPMKYFDTQNLCTCGGEIWRDVEAKKDTTMKQVEFEDNDSQRKVAMKITVTTRCEKCDTVYPDLT